MLNILTIDLEDYFMVSAFEGVVKREDWENFESRIERNTTRLLDILSSVRSPQHLKAQHSGISALKNNPGLSTPHLNLSPNASRLAKDYLISSPCSMRSAPCDSVRATFFCIGWVAERYPQLIREIHQRGHEIACHSYDHRIIYNMTPDEFREDIRKSRKILEDIIGEEVVGYRAPSYSITNKSQWALEILAEEGFKYDSSIFPIHHDFYGMPKAPRFPFVISLNGTCNFEFSVLNFSNSSTHSPTNASSDASAPQDRNTAAPLEGLTPNSEPRTQHSLLEFPISTVKLLGQNVPLSGGGYFRLLPYSIVKRGLNRINKKEGQPFIFYLHPWEIDPEQPRINGLSSRSIFRHYVNLDKTEFKFKKLLSDFEFSSIKELLGNNGSTGSPQHSISQSSEAC